ncbi:MAG: SDR family oxidoreductase [Bryobacter sp.]|nr:SDR family oxidoreductase [Bryobacter sp.]
MPRISITSSGAAITGSGGFIGNHLTKFLAAQSSIRHFPVGVENLVPLAGEIPPHGLPVLIHMAAAGTVITKLEAIPKMFEVTLGGMLNSIQAFRPERVIYTSSCSVYGNSPRPGGQPTWDDVHPISSYGLSKAAAERTLHQWAMETGKTGIVLRLGNVIGWGCAGLINYLVRHAFRHPDGKVPATMRGEGKVYRDYVPVKHVVRVLAHAPSVELAPGQSHVFNVGTGRTMSNGEVAVVVREWLATQGYELNVVFTPEPAFGESWYAGLNTQKTEEHFSLAPPSLEEVHDAVRDGAAAYLETLRQGEKQP